MKRTIRFVIIGIVLVAVVAVAAIWQPWKASQPQQETRSATVSRGSILVTVSASGIIEPQTRVSLAFEESGRVADVPVELADEVAAGDLLARLDTEQLALQAQQSAASLASAEAQLAQLTAGPRDEEVASAQANVRAAEAQVSAAAANRDQVEDGSTGAQIAAAEADVASAFVDQWYAERMHNRTMKCFTFKIPGRGEKTICPALGPIEEQARLNLAVTDEALTASRARLDEALAGADADQIRAARANVAVVTAQRDASQAQLDLLLAGATDEQIAAAKAQVTQARTALEQAELLLERASLHAPFAGVVAQVQVTAGELIAAGQPAITLVDASTFRMRMSVDEMDVGRLAEGQTAEITLDALPGVTLSGVIESIAPAATVEGGVVYYKVLIDLAPTDAPIRADMTASATVVVEELADVLTIPTWVVRVDETTVQTYVNRPSSGDTFERVDVTLGVRHQGVVQVLYGLSEGERVVWVDEERFSFGTQ